jgi:hypothetical protein
LAVAERRLLLVQILYFLQSPLLEAALAQVRLVQLVARAVLAEVVVNNQALAVQAQQDKE